MRKIPSYIILLLLVTTLFIGTASATTTVSLSDPLTPNDQVLVYVVGTDNGTAYIGTYTRNDTLTMQDGESYVFVFKPSAASIAKDPGTFFSWAGGSMGLALIFGICIALGATCAFLVLRIIPRYG